MYWKLKVHFRWKNKSHLYYEWKCKNNVLSSNVTSLWLYRKLIIFMSKTRLPDSDMKGVISVRGLQAWQLLHAILRFQNKPFLRNRRILRKINVRLLLQLILPILIIGLAICSQQRSLFIEFMATYGCFCALCESLRTTFIRNIHTRSNKRLRFSSPRSRSRHH